MNYEREKALDWGNILALQSVPVQRGDGDDVSPPDAGLHQAAGETKDAVDELPASSSVAPSDGHRRVPPKRQNSAEAQADVALGLRHCFLS